MKRILVAVLILTIAATAGISAYAYANPQPKTDDPSSTASKLEIVTIESDDSNAVQAEMPTEALADSAPTSFPSTQDEIIYKMLNSVDYFTTAQVSFSAVFPGFDIAQDYTIETNLDTGVSHQTCSDNFLQTRSVDRDEAYETYSNGELIREYNNLERTVKTVCSVERRRSLAEEWPGIEDRYYIDENGDPHYRYRSDPTNADMSGECLFPQVSAFAYLMDKNLWEIGENLTCHGRMCYSITGTVNESYSAQIGAKTFMMYVDQQTGVLLKLEAYGENGDIVSSMVVSEISIDAPMTRSSFQYDMSKYEGYTELQ